MSSRLHGLQHAADVVVHLVVREWISRQRFTLLGWGWPLLKQLLQLAVLAFIFTRVLDLGIDDYVLFVFSGLIAWHLFSQGAIHGTWAVIQHRHLLLQPRTPAPVLPLVGVLMPLLDFLVALPLLLALAYVQADGLHLAALVAIPMLVVQLLLTAGLAWLTSALAVVMRDFTSMVETLVFTFFYLTPIFYGLERAPGDAKEILEWNPLGVLIEGYRAVLMEGELPEAGPLLAVAALAVALAVLGYRTFQRIRPSFLDYL